MKLAPAGRHLRPAEACVTIVDTENLVPNGWGVARFYGPLEWATAKAEDSVDGLDGVETGRYGIDVSTWCDECNDYHSPEAECDAA